MKTIHTVGIVGAGTMGSALAQKFAQEGITVVLCDKNQNALEKGLQRINDSLTEAVNKKVLNEEQKNRVLQRVKSTIHISDLKNSDLILEAVFEDFNVKSSLFRELSEIVHSQTILATNTSSFSITELSQYVSYPERFIGMHYFYHAAKNRLVEIIPGEKTSEDVVKTAYYFSLQTGKDPIFTKDTYGFAVNRFFVPWLNESVRLFEENIATPGEIDEVAMKVFGIGMGPFALMNATGVPVAYHSEKTLEKFGPAYYVSHKLKIQAESGKNWDIDYVTNISPEKEKRIKERLLGVTFFVVAQILNEQVCTATDLNKGARIGLKWRKGPIELMNDLGIQSVQTLIEKYADRFNEKIPPIHASQIALNWVKTYKIGTKAYILFDRPEDLNALNEDVFQQLDKVISEINSDTSVDTIIITSTGKAFVAGADIKFFVNNIESKNIDKIIEFTKYAQNVLKKIDESQKRVIAILNGLTLGGGLELAMCADEIYALPAAVTAFPETGIGIYPGLGGTQRTQKRIGKYLTKYLIFTGKFLSAREANEINLIDGIISFEDYTKVLDGQIEHLQPEKTSSCSDIWKEIENKMKDFTLSYSNGDIPFSDIIAKKAPLAIRYANLLIEEGKGPESEIEYLRDIFSSEDALNGLKNIGKAIAFKGK